MNADEFHKTPCGARVEASIGNALHCALVTDKLFRERRFLLQVKLADGSTRLKWRSAAKCEQLPDSTPLGAIGGYPHE